MKLKSSFMKKFNMKKAQKEPKAHYSQRIQRETEDRKLEKGQNQL